MTASEDQVMEMRPRCLVIVPGLSFEEFQEQVWQPIRATHESMNWYLGDALSAAEQWFGERSSQLLDEGLTPARMAQLKWVAEAIPPARRRDDCNWTMHRLVAGLFNRRRGIFPAAYLDRKAELQDGLLARAAGEGWHTDSMKAEIERLESEALDKPPPDYLSNGGPSFVDDGIADEDEAESEERAAGEMAEIVAAAPPEDGDRMVEAEQNLEEPDSGAGSDEPIGDAAFRQTDTNADPSALRGCIEAVRKMGTAERRDYADALRLADDIAVALGRPLYGRNPLPTEDIGAALSLFPSAWRRRVEDSFDLAGTLRWTATGLKGAQMALGISPRIECAITEAALAGRTPSSRRSLRSVFRGMGARWRTGPKDAATASRLRGDGLMLSVLSLGAGVQSTTLALMAAHGEIPVPDVAIFADTGWEPRRVYDHLDWLCSPNVLPFPVVRVSNGNIRADLIENAKGKVAGKRSATPPFFVVGRDGREAMLSRQCTDSYKLDPIIKKTRELIGLKPRQRAPKTVTVKMLIGISADEAHRAKPSQIAMTTRTLQNLPASAAHSIPRSNGAHSRMTKWPMPSRSTR